MTLGELYRKAIEVGIKNDPRGEAEVKRELEKAKKDFETLPEREKEFFDKEKLHNPYADTRILYGDAETEITSILIGIDMEGPELLLADRLREKGERVDLVLAHHPEGYAYARLADVMPMQAGIIHRHGVPVNVAEALIEERAAEIDRRISPVNHQRSVDVARALKLPFMCLHTPSDNCVTTYLQKLFDQKKPETLDDIIDLLLEIPEYRKAKEEQAGPRILIGSKSRRAGKIFVDMTGGTEGSTKIFENVVNAGINTIVCMHLSEEHRKEAEKYHLNVIIAGHISSDNLGLNLLLDQVLPEGVRIIEVSGFRRFTHS